jgi:hypothetical protein
LSIGAATEPFVSPHRYVLFPAAATLLVAGSPARCAEDAPARIVADPRGRPRVAYEARLFVAPAEGMDPPPAPLRRSADAALSGGWWVPWRQLITLESAGRSAVVAGLSRSDFGVPLDETGGVERPAAQIGRYGLRMTRFLEAYVDGSWRPWGEVLPYLERSFEAGLGAPEEPHRRARLWSWYAHAERADVALGALLLRTLVPGRPRAPDAVAAVADRDRPGAVRCRGRARGTRWVPILYGSSARGKSPGRPGT